MEGTRAEGKAAFPRCMFVIVSVCACHVLSPPVAFAIIILRPGAVSLKLETLGRLDGVSVPSSAQTGPRDTTWLINHKDYNRFSHE